MTVIKTLIFTVFVPGTVAAWIPIAILSAPGTRGSIALDGLRYVGLPAMIIGASAYFWCAWDFAIGGKGTPAPIDPPKELVVRGLYKYVRNPMYVGVLTLLIGESFWFQSIQMFEYALLVFSLFFAFVVFYEEPVLKRKFGESYMVYRTEVPRWIPRLTGRKTKQRLELDK